MAEVIAAIGLAASVAGLVEIAGKSAIILRNTYQTMENAPSIVHTLCKDLDAFHSATQNLLSSLESFNEKGLGLKKKSIDSLDTSIKNSTATLSIVLQTLKLEKFKVGDVRPDITMGFKQKIQFVSKKKEIEGLLKDLDRQKGTLQFCLQVLTIDMLAEDNRQNFSPPLRQATTKKVQAMEARMIESVHQDDNTVLDSGLSNEPGSLIVKDDDGDARILFTNPNEKHVDRALEQALETAPKTDSADSFEEEVEVAESFSGVEKHAPGDKKQNQSEELQHDPALPIDNSHDPKLQLEFMMAVIDGDHESLKSILHEYRDRIDIDEVDGEGQSSLGTAVSFDYVATAKILIDARANLDIANKTGFTPLGHAQKNGNLELMQALLDAGADKLPKQLPHWPTYGPATYLAQAVMQGRRDIVQILLNHKVDVNDPTHLYKARMPLVQVCERSQDLILVRMLLNAGADVNCGHGNCPPLFPAAMHSFPDLFRVLLEAGADPDLVPKNWGRTSPRSLCEGKDELKKILMRHELKKTLCGKTRS